MKDLINKFDENGNKHGYWQEQEFESISRYPCEGVYVHGVKDGYWKYYRTDKSFDSTGIYQEGTMKNGTPNGFWKFYDICGDKFGEMIFIR